MYADKYKCLISSILKYVTLHSITSIYLSVQASKTNIIPWFGKNFKFSIRIFFTGKLGGVFQFYEKNILIDMEIKMIDAD